MTEPQDTILTGALPPADPVNHPDHYTSSPATCECGKTIECIQVVRHLGNIIKYLWRYPIKNGLEDLKKAAWYLNDLIKQEEAKHDTTTTEKTAVPADTISSTETTESKNNV